VARIPVREVAASVFPTLWASDAHGTAGADAVGPLLIVFSTRGRGWRKLKPTLKTSKGRVDV
jgi:hypothetical protein